MNNYLLKLRKAKAAISTTFFSLALVTVTSCSDENEAMPVQNNPLRIEVTTSDISSRGGIIDDTTLPDASQLGVALTSTSGGAYNGQTYHNILFEASGTGASQTWDTDDNVMVSDVTGNVYAYYPYSSTVTDMTAVPVETASQTDYMYALPAEVSDGATKVTLTMKHALAAVRLNIVKGNFSSDAKLNEIRIRSAAMGTSATLNAYTGALSSVQGASTWFTDSHDNVAVTASPDAYSEFLVIPNGTASAAIDMFFTINGSEYTLQTTPSTALEAGYIYEYTAVLNDAEVTLKSVTVSPWTTQNKGSQNGVPYSVYVKAVKADGTLIDVADADETCIAVALLDGPKHFWIEKYGESNAAWNGNTTLYWDYSYSDLSLTNYTSAGSISNKNWRGWGSGAISDFNGKANTEVIAASSTNAKDMCTVLATFNAASDQNQGYSDWYVPACGQLYLMYLHKSAINTALTKIGGTTIADSYYWSSSEFSSYYARSVYFANGSVDYYYKDNDSRVRVVRDIE